jgi:hypothetical protein
MLALGDLRKEELELLLSELGLDLSFFLKSKVILGI